MTESTKAAPRTLTLGDLCPEAQGEIASFVRGTSRDESRQLPKGILWRMLSRRVNARVDRVLETPIEEVLKRGWEKLERLRAHKQLPPGEPFHEQVGAHTISSLHEPSLEIEIDNHHIGSLEFSIGIVVHILAVRLTGKDAHIERAVPGECKISGDFSCKVTVYGIAQTFPEKIGPIEFQFPGEGITFDRPIPIP